MDSIEISEVHDRSVQLVEQLTEVWRASVRATHHFLSESEIAKIEEYVPQALKSVAVLIIAQEEEGKPKGFMGIENGRLEMLFLLPEWCGKGVGKRLLQYGIQHYGVHELTVNEQNPEAIGFYEHMGFRAYKRTECDEQGAPYPLLYMKR